MGMLQELERQGVDPAMLDAVRSFRTAHEPPAEQLGRVPDPSVVYRGKEVWEQAICSLLCGENLLLEGPKATGKNVLAQGLARLFNRPAWDVSFHIDMDALQLVGTDTFVGGSVSFRPGPIVLCAEQGGFGVLDEINMARSEALAVLHAALDQRRAIDVPGYRRVELDEATRFVATMNAGYQGTRELNEALVSRFVVISMPELDADGIEQLLRETFPALRQSTARQFALLFQEIRSKCAHGELTDKVLDLRGLIASVRLMSAGLPATHALRICMVNKALDPYERSLAQDVVSARISKDMQKGRIFE